MQRFEQDWLEFGSRVARGLHYQHRRNLRLLEGQEPFEAEWQATAEAAAAH